MGYDFGDMGNRLIDACLKYPPDFQLINELLDRGIDLNMLPGIDRDDPCEKSETILSEIILNYSESLDRSHCQGCEKDICYGCSYHGSDGQYLPHIVKLFLEHGFDCSAQDGLVGAVCLQNLIWATYDKYILDAAKLLLKSGAKPDCVICNLPEDETVLDWVAVKESAAKCVDEDHSLSNLFHTLYEIMDASVKGELFDGIQHFDHCVGKHIHRVLLCSGKGSVQGLFQMNTPRGSYEHCFREQLIMWCEDVPLCINGYTDAIIDPRVPSKMNIQTDVSEFFSDCIGHRIIGFSFDYFSFTKVSTCYHQPITLIHLDNGKTIRFSTNSGEVKRAETTAYFCLI